MQASRLLSILMRLQTCGRMTAPQLARELEVSQRTVLRDIDALSAAGVPVWGEPGRNGGFELQAGWSTQLTGMTEPEAQALLLAGLPQAAQELGLGQAATQARLKLLASVPKAFRAQSEQVAQRLHLDPLDWYRAPDTPEQLQAVAQAVWQGRCIRVRYESWKGLQNRQLAPLGLVLKAGAWYLVALPAVARKAGAQGKTEGQTEGRTERLAQPPPEPRTYRLASLRKLQLLDETVRRPKNFDLAAFWRASSQRFESELLRLPVRLRATRRGLGWLRNARLPHSRLEGDEIEMVFESEEMAARQLLAMGTELEVLAPASLRTALRVQAQQVAALYR
jgi:predicted DNA-binding transcriptional regulator YafY